MDAALLNPSKYIKAVEFRGRDVTLTIRAVKIEELEKEDNSTEKKGVITFAETAKGWVLNVTNVRALVALWGRETDNWLGHKVTLYPEENDSSPTGFAIRVRGSPDIEKDVKFTLKLARKKPRTVTLKALGKNGNGHGKPTSAPQPAPTPQPTGDAFPNETDEEPVPEEEAGALEPLPDGQPL